MKTKLSPFLLLCIMGGLAIFSMGVPVSTVGFIAAASTVVGIVVSLPAGVVKDMDLDKT